MFSSLLTDLTTSGDSYHTKIKEDTLNTCSNIILLSIIWKVLEKVFRKKPDLTLFHDHISCQTPSCDPRCKSGCKSHAGINGQRRWWNLCKAQLLLSCWKGAWYKTLHAGLACFDIHCFHLFLGGQSVLCRASKWQSTFYLLSTCKENPGHFLKGTASECITFTLNKCLLKGTW